MGAPTGALCFLQKHRLICLRIYKSCVTGGRSCRGFLFSSNTPSYMFECVQFLCYWWTLPQGLFVFFKNTTLYFWVYASPVLRVDAPTGAFCFLQKHLPIFLSVFKSCVMGGRSHRGFLFSSKTQFYICWVYAGPLLPLIVLGVCKSRVTGL